MEFIHLLILSIIQGLTEFLPISSSAHLILLPLIAGWQDQGLAIDIAAHLGSLCAVILYFRKDLGRVVNAGLSAAAKRQCDTMDGKLFWCIVIASPPVLIAGFLLRDMVANYLREPLIIALASIGFGLLLWAADIKGDRNRALDAVTWRDAILIGLAQTLALVPGTSRSGVTITAALILGLDRIAAARFSFLTAIPIILAATGYEVLQLIRTGATIDIINFITVAGFSAISAMLAIHYFLRFVEQVGMLPFMIYRVIFGAVLLALFI